MAAIASLPLHGLWGGACDGLQGAGGTSWPM